MTSEHLYFITFCVGNLSEALHKSASQVYGALRSSGVLNDYIIPCYDVLHTFSKEYIVEDLTEALRERGALICKDCESLCPEKWYDVGRCTILLL